MRRALLGLLLILPASAHGRSKMRIPTPDLLIFNANVLTLDPAQPHATTLLIDAGKILAVGSADVASHSSAIPLETIDLHGATVVQGFVDAHIHLASLGAALDALDLSGAKDAAELVARVAARVKSATPGAWVEGEGWNQNDWPGGAFPTREGLDRVAPENPVVLDRVDGHAIFVNAKALAIAGIDAKTPDPKGGKILRDAKGAATGVLLDDAPGLVFAKMPPASAEEIVANTLRGQAWCLAHGLTGVHDAGVGRKKLDALLALEKDGRLTMRVYAMLASGDAELLDEWFAKGPKTSGLVTVRSIKISADGALESRGASLLADYSDDPGNRGLVTATEAEVEKIATRAFAKKWQVCVHAIGDRANREVLDAFEHALAKTKTHATDVRPRIEHAQVVSPEDLPRFARLGVIASMQPWHVVGDMPWAEARVGAERIRGAYAWRTILDSHARLAGGSDAPFGGISGPLQGIHAAVTRQDDAGNPASGWHPEQRMTRDEALRAFTTDPAWAAFEERQAGTIAVGNRADLVVLSGDPATGPERDLVSLRVLRTIVNGRVVETEK